MPMAELHGGKSPERFAQQVNRPNTPNISSRGQRRQQVPLDKAHAAHPLFENLDSSYHDYINHDLIHYRTYID